MLFSGSLYNPLNSLLLYSYVESKVIIDGTSKIKVCLFLITFF